MVAQPILDRLIALGVATSMHVALGVALLLMTQGGATAPSSPNRHGGDTMNVHLVPLAQIGGQGAAASASDARPTSAAGLPAPRDEPAVEATPSSERPIGSTAQGGRAFGDQPGAVIAAAGSAAAGADLPSAEVMAFRARLQAHLARYRLYPASAKDTGRQGTVFLHFTMDRNGHVVRSWIERSSGDAEIDHEALAAVRRAVPLPPLPSVFQDTLDVRMPVLFALE